MTVPDITLEMKEKLKEERLMQYQARIFQTQMDIAAYKAVEDENRLQLAEKQLEALMTAYEAISVM